MITRIAGTLIARGENSVVVEAGGLGYEIQLPPLVFRALESKPLGEPLQLETIYYFAMEQTRATPVLLGFANVIEKEFFERLLTVPKMGPRGALNALAHSVSTIARAIETADYAMLQTLPGVGKQKARDLVATLQGKVARFALMQDGALEQRLHTPAPLPNAAGEALQLLLLLGHKRIEAERMVSEALAAEPQTAEAEALVRVIYRRQQESR